MSAAQSLPELLRCSKAAHEKGMPGADAQYVKVQLGYMLHNLMDAIPKEMEIEVATTMLESCNNLGNVQKIQKIFCLECHISGLLSDIVST